MLDPQRIKEWIAHELPCEHVSVDGDGRHFEAVIVSESFTGLSRVARQQKVNAVLKARFDSGELHALSMQTLTPEEWRNRG
jgi:acid stress-induced BolA-like protein IbaG/YrbA